MNRLDAAIAVVATTDCAFCTAPIDPQLPEGHRCQPFDLIHHALHRSFAAAIADVAPEHVHALLMQYDDVPDAKTLKELLDRTRGLDVIAKDPDAYRYIDSMLQLLERYHVAGAFPTFRVLRDTQLPWFRDVVEGLANEQQLLWEYGRTNRPADLIELLRTVIPQLGPQTILEDRSMAARLLYAEVAHFASRCAERRPGLRRCETALKSAPRRRPPTRGPRQRGDGHGS